MLLKSANLQYIPLSPAFRAIVVDLARQKAGNIRVLKTTFGKEEVPNVAPRLTKVRVAWSAEIAVTVMAVIGIQLQHKAYFLGAHCKC